MAERDILLASIVKTTADYRAGEIAPPTPSHVQKWIEQFDSAVQIPILREMDHVLKSTYISQKIMKSFLADMFKNTELVGNDPCAFWKCVKFLDIQDRGTSQKEMLALFDELLKENCDFTSANCGTTSPDTFVYLDDGVFTGNRVRYDLEEWITEEAPEEARVHIITIAEHSGGQNYAHGKIKKAARDAGKKITLEWWQGERLEDERDNIDVSDVLRPTQIPDDPRVKEYAAGIGIKYPLEFRTLGHVSVNNIFSSDAGRQVLEDEFLKKGVHIRELCHHLKPNQRPLGYTPLDTLGFGSLTVTFRNCPNNAPLVLWTGDPWYPLFPRKINEVNPF